ncbi:MAG TPA: hypothetical protein VNG71_02390 [Pyrinomonadaceae bacterium]|nr:hypothetical protein [Pyrinomonadaceae bacterium]
MKNRTVTLIAVVGVNLFLIWLVACAPKPAPESVRQLDSATPPAGSMSINISYDVPSELNPSGGGAPKATLQQAAAFAWQEFIALNWPAANQTGAANTRDMPDKAKKFGDQSGPLVWQTYRGKVETFPGNGSATVGPPGSGIGGPTPSPALPDYGYDAAPQYIYSTNVGPCTAPAPAQSPVASAAWVNADEISQIGLDHMYAGVLPGPSPSPNSSPTPVNSQPQLIRFLAKANRTQYKYVVGSQYWYQNGDGSSPVEMAAQSFINTTSSQPSPKQPQSPFVSFPPGTIEVKAAFRELAANEDPKRFHVTTVRYYEQGSGNGCYREAPMALIALHIIQKTPSAPSFIYATFEQADNILLPQNDSSGKPVPLEETDGSIKKNLPTPTPSTPTTPGLSYQDSQTNPLVSANGPLCANPGNQIYYQNIPPGAPQSPGEPVGGSICINYRDHTIPQAVIDANQAAHNAMNNSPNSMPNSPWQYYKLVNVQSYPFNKPADDSDPNHGLATFFQSNSVVETNYLLQNFSGRIAANFAVTNFPPPSPSVTPSPLVPVVPPNDYVYSGSPPPTGVTSYNMGGCMGCHANAQSFGFDFSFILKFAQDAAPDFPTTPAPTLANKYGFSVESLIRKNLQMKQKK